MMVFWNAKSSSGPPKSSVYSRMYILKGVAHQVGENREKQGQLRWVAGGFKRLKNHRMRRVPVQSRLKVPVCLQGLCEGNQ